MSYQDHVHYEELYKKETGLEAKTLYPSLTYSMFYVDWLIKEITIKDKRIQKYLSIVIRDCLKKIKGGKMFITKDIKEKFCDLLGEASPENISCDGECSLSEIKRKRASISKRWKELEKEIGFKVSEDEANEFFYELYIKPEIKK